MPFDYNTLTQNFGRIWPTHVNSFAELMITLRKHFRGDLDLLLVIAVIGSRTLPSRRIDGLAYEHFERGETLESPGDPINVQSVADCTGIPRETVRRKVRDLIETGWVSTDEGGALEVTDQAARDLMPATEATLRYLVTVGAACVDAVHQQ